MEETTLDPVVVQKKVKRRHRQQASGASGPSSEAGPSSLPLVSERPKERRKKRDAKGKANPETDQSPAAVKKSSKKTTQSDNTWDAVPIAAREVSKISPVWSRDGRFFFTVSDTFINVHAATAPAYKLLSTISGLNKEGHRKRITSLVLHPTNPLQIITSADDGLIKVWDWVEGRLVRTIALSRGGRVKQLCVGQVGGRWQIFAASETTKKDKTKLKGLAYSWKILRTPLIASGSTEDIVSDVGKLSFRPSALLISPRFTYLVALSGNKAYTYRLPTSLPNGEWVKPACVKFVSDQDFTCGAFAPERIIGNGNEEEWFATGDVKGVIRLWHGLTSAFRQIDLQAGSEDLEDPSQVAERRLPTTSLHWHAHAVGALAFTPSGAQLLSVGEESVLVQWHLASGKREYLPRLGGRPIISLAVKLGSRGAEEEWWIRNLDGGVLRIGAASGQIINVGQSVRIDPLRSQEIKYYPFTIHPPTQSLVVPSSHPSTLQFIDPLSSTVLFDLEVAPSNRVARRDERELEAISVEHVAFNNVTQGGNRWMATVEGRIGDELEGGGYVKTLKVWKWIGDRYTIITQYPRPHGMSDITTIAFIPTPTPAAGASAAAASPYLLTTSIDGVAKIWHVRQAKKIEQGKSGKKNQASSVELYWSTRSSFSYRSMPIYGATFSPDSSILALAHGSVVTIWDVENNVLLQALDSGLSDHRQVGFVGRDGRYLAAAGVKKGLAVWDLLSCQVTWSDPTVTCHRLLTSTSDFFIVSHYPTPMVAKTKISIYTASTASPVRVATADAKINQICVLPTSSITDPRALQFIAVSKTGDINRFGDDIARAVQVGTNLVSEKGERTTSIWQEMFGKDAFLEIEEQPQDISAPVVQPGTGKPVEVYEGASHTLPPVGLLFDAFLDEILVPRSAQVDKQELDDEAIIYDVSTSDIGERLSRPELAGRNIGDEEVEELEVFFRDLLSTRQPKSTPKSKALPNGHGLVNGNKSLPNGTSPHEKMDVETAADVTPSKKSGSRRKHTQQGAKGDEDGEEVVGSGGKGRGKKRKAPREQEAS